MEIKQAVKHIAVYVSLAIMFGLGLFYFKGATQGSEFFMCYLVELCLSVDNLFVFALIFTQFNVAKEHQHKILFWGILGAIVFRLTFISAGIGLVHLFDWILYVFAAFLIYTGFKLLSESESEPSDMKDSKIYKVLSKYLRLTNNMRTDKFWMRLPTDSKWAWCEKEQLWFTPLFLVLCLIEISDILFAFDSIPAAFAITQNIFIIFTANIFAILGLRSMYFVLQAMLERFKYLNYGLSAILTLIGTKMLVNHATGIELISTPVSLIVTVSILTLSVFYSMYKTRMNPVEKFAREVLEVKSKITYDHIGDYL